MNEDGTTTLSEVNETQLTFGEYGHTLNSTQVFSPDDTWIFYDTRNDDTHISRTGRIEKVNIKTSEVVEVYRAENQTLHGPGVGAVACHPYHEKIIFIHGLIDCNAQQPYGFTRRFGAILNMKTLPIFMHAEARSIQDPLISGALRGGTHAHSWSGDGEWISFTYNDYIMELREKETEGVMKDLRTIGVMSPLQKVSVLKENDENFSGEYFTVVAATVSEKPTPGSNEIDQAYDECWIGKDGYQKLDGTRQKRAIAFQGIVRSESGTPITEIFVADIPDDITKPNESLPLQGTLSTRPNVPKSLTQRRLTFLDSKNHAAIQGLRYRARTSPEGDKIYFLLKDDASIVQVFSVPTVGGAIHQTTHLPYSLQAQFNLSPNGKQLSVIADNSIWLIDIFTGKEKRLTKRTADEDSPIGGALWSHRGNVIVYNRYVGIENDRYVQIFKVDLK